MTTQPKALAAPNAATERFKVWADREQHLAHVRCQGEENAERLRQYLSRELPGVATTGVRRIDDSPIFVFEVPFDDNCSPLSLQDVLMNCPAIDLMRMFPVSVVEQPHFLVRPDILAKWLDDRDEGLWWTADGDPVLMSRMELPAPADELAQAIRDIGRPLLVADPTRSGHGEELPLDKVDNVLDADEWGRRCFFLRWKNSDIDWLMVQEEDGEGEGY